MNKFGWFLFIIPYYFSLIIFLLSLLFLVLMKYNSYIYVINYSLSVKKILLLYSPSERCNCGYLCKINIANVV